MRGITYFIYDDNYQLYQKYIDSIIKKFEFSLFSLRVFNDYPVRLLCSENLYTQLSTKFVDVEIIPVKSTIKKENNFHKNLLSKLLAYYPEYRFDTTLYLDCDTIILKNLDFGFDCAEKYDMSLCIDTSRAKNKFADLKTSTNIDPSLLSDYPADLPAYNSGVVFFKSCDVVDDIVNRCNFINSKYNMWSDQLTLSLSLWDLNKNPFVLNQAWNHRPAYIKDELFIYHYIYDCNFELIKKDILLST